MGKLLAQQGSPRVTPALRRRLDRERDDRLQVTRRCAANRHLRVGRERRDPAVPRCAVVELLLEAQRLERRLEQGEELRHPLARRRRREQLLLRLDAEVDTRRELEVEYRRGGVRHPDVGAGELRERAEELERPLAVLVVWDVVLVDDLLDLARRERPALR